jgi:hypothetical protein
MNPAGRTIRDRLPRSLFLRRLVAIAAIALSGCAIANKMDGVSDARALQKTGEHAEAVVIQIWDTGITVNNDPVIGLLVEVHPPDRPAYQAKIPKSLVSRVHIPQFQPGSRVAVRIDPGNPNHVALDVYEY